MSEWGATQKGGRAAAAWEFRERYILYGEKYSEFFCPFCDIPLVAVLIYTDAELSKSPHFAARGHHHLYGCNGEPIEIDPPERNPPQAHYKPRKMSVPEALTDRPTPREYRPKDGPSKPAAPPTIIDVTSRRRNAGSLGTPIPRTCLLRSIVEARDIELKEIYSRARNEKWPDDKLKKEIGSMLAGMPLRLDDATTYDDAFRGPSFLHRTHRRIYHGIGTISRQEESLAIHSTKTGKLKGVLMPFQVLIDPAAVNVDSPQSHIAFLETLETLVATKKEFRWYAYGMSENRSGTLVVPIRNLDHLYVKKMFQAKPQ